MGMEENILSSLLNLQRNCQLEEVMPTSKNSHACLHTHLYTRNSGSIQVNVGALVFQ